MQTVAVPGLSNDQLIQMLRARNIRVVECLYDQYSPLLYGLIKGVLNDPKRSEEVLFRTFIHAWNHYSRYDQSQQSICMWLISIARQFAISELPLSERSILESHLLNSLNENSGSDEMKVFNLLFMHGLSISKIAARLGCNELKVKTLLHGATCALKTGVSSK